MSPDTRWRERVGDTVWRLLSKGDGGGCAFHPTQPHQILRQYVQADWDFIPAMDPVSPALRSSTGSRTTSETNEDSRSSFYGKPAVAPGATPKQARVFIGTTRIWYSPDWESASKTMHWQTIPTGGGDPFGSKPAQDVLTFGRFRDPVLAIRVLHPGDAEQNFDGTKLLVLCKHTVRVFTCTSASAHARNRWTNSDASIVSGPTGKAKKASDGSLTEDTAFDVLWWYNGAGKWYPTGLRNAPVDATAGTAGCKAPAHSVIVDPDDNKAVYVGNSVGVWRGQLDESGPHPSWTWKPLLDGLPQVLVQDLSFFKKGTLKLLRAATVSRGVWECDLSDSPRSVGSCYIRSLPYDTGRATLPANPTDAIGSTKKLHLHQSPDIVLFRSGKAPWGSRLPNESEMLGAMDQTSFPKETLDAFVMVHYRHTTPLDGTSVKVDLFLIMAKVADVTIDNNWRAAVIGAVNGPARPFPYGLSHLRRISPGNQIDARNPGVVKTKVNMGHFITGQLVDHATVMAVVTAPGNDLQSSDLSPPTLEEIIRKSPRIAVRQVSRISGLLI
ncbi:MAG: hypothetical protein CSA73_00490 [Rhodobacterales bacterium]|nr:MAG: hypothetical protein CSA73_00490 [Rhodobacterales bacterium]